MMMKGEQVIHHVWKQEQEILDVIHKICSDYGLRYSLAYGTLIGAVRHGGFIPWDDDIDLMMPREDYEKLLSIWDQVAPKGYIIQNAATDPDFTQNFTKIRKDHTTFLQSESERSKNYHKGIFVDIFPGDRVAPTRLGRKSQFIACAIDLLLSRGHVSGSGGGISLIERTLLSVPKCLQGKCNTLAQKLIKRWNKFGTGEYIFACTIQSCKVYYPDNLFDDIGQISFEGKMYSCVADYDTALHVEYGNYMQLPPEEERVWKHHPILIDFEHNYEELAQK